MTSMWCVYFVNHKTRTTTWDDPRLLSTGDADALHYALRKVVYFQSQPSMRLIADAKRVRRGWVFEDIFAAIMRFRPETPRKRLMVKFGSEDARLDYGGVSRGRFFLVSHEMFNPSNGLFEYSVRDN